jgi:hypothetical protein
VAKLRFSRDAAYKFADAEKDLNCPTVSAVAFGGFIPLIKTPAELAGIRSSSGARSQVDAKTDRSA